MNHPIRKLRVLLTVGVAAAALAGCSPSAGGGAGPLGWRDLDLVVPAGWTVLDQRSDLLLVASSDIRATDEELDADPVAPSDPDSNDVVAVQLTTDASSSADDWRSLITTEGGVIEEDASIEIGGLPATSLRFRWTTNGVDTRERVVLVPSRQLVLLLQPVPVMGQTTAPEVYDRHLDEFEALLASIEWGRPEGA